MEVWKHLRAILLLPGMVLGVIPAAVLWLGGLDSFHIWQCRTVSIVTSDSASVNASIRVVRLFCMIAWIGGSGRFLYAFSAAS